MTSKRTDIAQWLVLVVFFMSPLIFLIRALFPTLQILTAEELSLSNTLYMFKHYGIMVYPAHLNFDSMVVHPPPIYYLHSLFYIVLDNVMYSIMATNCLLAFACFALVYRLPLPRNWKLAFACGFLLMLANPEMRISIRPLLPIAMMSVSGWLCLEASRRTKWNRNHLVIGSTLIGLAAISHYSAAFSVLGLAIYGILAFLSNGPIERIKTTVAVLAPAMLVVTTYFAINVIPNFTDILHGIQNAPHGNGIIDNIQSHFKLFDLIPTSILALVVLMVHPKLRWIGFATAPVWVFTLLFVFQKYDYWYTEVWLLGFGALVIIMERLSNWLWIPIWLLSAYSAVQGRPYNATPPNPGIEQIARASVKDILPSDAKVGSRLNLWYISGGSKWYNIQPELYWKDSVADERVRKYAVNFDALADHSHRSNVTNNGNGKTLSNWYLDSVLHLEGFFLCRYFNRSTDVNMLLFGASESDSVQGYTLVNKQLCKYTESDSGSYEFFSCLIPVSRAKEITSGNPKFPLERYQIGQKQFDQSTANLNQEEKCILYGILCTDSTDQQQILDEINSLVVRDNIRMNRRDINIDSLTQVQLENENPILFYRDFNAWTEDKPLYQSD